MALETMGFTKKTAVGGVEILYNSEYVGSALTLDTSAFTDGVCKAGTPMTAAGTKAAGADAVGVLLHDVVQARPQGTIVVGGYINTAIAQEHSGVAIDDAAKAAMKNLVFM